MTWTFKSGITTSLAVMLLAAAAPALADYEVDASTEPAPGIAPCVETPPPPPPPEIDPPPHEHPKPQKPLDPIN